MSGACTGFRLILGQAAGPCHRPSIRCRRSGHRFERFHPTNPRPTWLHHQIAKDVENDTDSFRGVSDHCSGHSIAGLDESVVSAGFRNRSLARA